jgi:hypothetical protein
VRTTGRNKLVLAQRSRTGRSRNSGPEKKKQKETEALKRKSRRKMVGPEKKKLAPGSGSWRPATFGHYGYPYPAIAGRVGASVFLLKS